MTVVPLTAEDAALLYAEAPGTQLQIGALCFFEAGPLRDSDGVLRRDDLRDHVDARLDRLPRFRQRIAPVLGDAAPPMWVDDADFDVERHVRSVRLPDGTGQEGLQAFMDRLLAESMDPAHPLWEIIVVDGVTGPADDVVAVIVRAHHVMADGIALHAAATLLLDPEPRPFDRPSGHRRPARWRPAPHPGDIGLTVRALTERTRRQVALTVDAARTLAPRRIVPTTRFVARTAGSACRLTDTLAPAMDLTGPTGRRRAFAWGSVPMADVVAVKTSCGATVNDVVLAVATGALRRHLEAAGAFDRRARPPRALIPLGDPTSAEGRSSNRFSVTSVELPVAEDDPLERVRLLHDAMHLDAASSVRTLMPHVFSIVDVLPPPLLRAVVPTVLSHQPLVNLAVSNIPGSRRPLHLWEARMLSLHPFIDVVGSVAVIIGVLSYCDDLGIGITVDPDVAGDPDGLLTDVRDATAELVGLVR